MEPTSTNHTHHNEKKQIPLAETIMGKIKRGELLMRPRWHFVLKAALALLGGAVVALAALLLVSFIFFALRSSGLAFMPLFGFHGIRIFFFSLPWILIGAVILFVIVLEVLVRRYSFAYRTPLLLSLCGLLLFTLLGGLLLFKIGFHERLMRYANERQIPGLAPFYRRFSTHSEFVHLGIFRYSHGGDFSIFERGGREVRIRTSSTTRFPSGQNWKEGDEMVVLGSGTSTVEAEGVKKIK